MNSVSVRGKVIQKVLESVGDAARRAHVLASVEPASIGKGLSSLVPGAWYPVSWLAALEEALVRDEGKAAVFELLKKTSAEISKHTPGHVASHLLAPKDLLLRATSVIQENFAGLSCTVLEQSDSLQEREYRAVSGIPARIWDHVEGSLAGLLDNGRCDASLSRVDESPIYLRLRVEWRLLDAN